MLDDVAVREGFHVHLLRELVGRINPRTSASSLEASAIRKTSISMETSVLGRP